jgi:hypothetical protein
MSIYSPPSLTLVRSTTSAGEANDHGMKTKPGGYMLPRFGLLLMIVVVSTLGLFAAHTSLLLLMGVILVGFLAGGMRVRARLRPDNRL